MNFEDDLIHIEDYQEFLEEIRTLAFVNFLVTFNYVDLPIFSSKADAIENLQLSDVNPNIIDELDSYLPRKQIDYHIQCTLKHKSTLTLIGLQQIIKSTSMGIYTNFMMDLVEKKELKLYWDSKNEDFIFKK